MKRYVLVLAVLLLALSLNTSTAKQVQLKDSTSLYLTPSMSLDTAASGEGSVSIPPSLGVRQVAVGTWRSEPFRDALNISTTFTVHLWARGSGVQRSISFSVSVNGQGPLVTPQSQISSTPKEYVASGDLEVSVKKGEPVEVSITALYSGTGAELLLGKSSPSRLEFQDVLVYLYSVPYPRGGGRVGVNTTVYSPLGTENLKFSMAVAGPYVGRNFTVDLLNPDKVVESATQDDLDIEYSEYLCNVYWTWDHSSAPEGTYYIITYAEDSDGNIYANRAIYRVEYPEPFIVEWGATTGFILLGLVSGAGYWFFRKRFSGRARTLITVGVIGIVVVSGIAAAASSPFAKPAGRKAPDFTLTSTDGKTFSLSDFSGKVIVLDLMATWCPTCSDEMPELVKLHEKHPDVLIITVDVDPSESDAVLSRFKEKYGADWLFARDTDNVWVRYQDPYQPYIPTLVVINPQGYISFQKADLIKEDQLEKEVKNAYSGAVGSTARSTGGIHTLAFLTGLLSFFAPCAFPMLPAFIGYYITRKEEARLSNSLKAGMYASAGILGIFLLVGGLVAAAGSTVVPYLMYLTPLVGLLVILLGLAMLLGRTDLFEGLGGRLQWASSKMPAGSAPPGMVFYGVAYGLAAMGCQLPVFIALVMAGFVAGGPAEAVEIFLIFSLGMCVMMVATAVLTGMAKKKAVEGMKRMMPLINRFCAVLLILVGAYFLLEGVF